MNATAQRIDPWLVLRLTGRRYGVSVHDLKSERRTANLVLARHVAVWMLRRFCGLSYTEIGNHLNRDHTTAMYSEKRIEALLKVDSTARASFESILAGELGEEHGSGI